MDEVKKGLKALKNAHDYIRNFEFQFGLGAAIPSGDSFTHAYWPSGDFDFGFGYRLSEAFGLLLDFNGARFISGNDNLTGGFDFTDVSIALLGKVRLTPNGVRPYFFAGPAVGGGSFQRGASYQGLDGNVNFSDNGHFMVSGGVGVEIPLGNMHLYPQGGVNYDLVGSTTGNFASMGTNITFIPITVGLLFGR